MANGKTWGRNCHTDSRLLTQSLGDREMIMNGKWQTVKLGDVFTLQMGKTPDRNKLSYFSKVGNKWISIADITKSDKFIKETKECITDVAVQESGIKKIPQNTVIMSFKLSIGKTAITTEVCYSNEAIMAFLPNGLCDFDNNYLYHLFSNKNWSEGSNKAVKGITLNKESLSNVYIPLPPLETQQKIAAVLDKVQKIISESKAILEKYDTLIKSRFIEMFGDPIQNPMGWEVKKLKETTDIITGNTPSRKEKDNYGYFIEWIKTDNITDKNYITTAAEYLSEKGEKLGRTVEAGSILMACIAGSLRSIGRVALTDRKVAFNQQINAIVPKKYNNLFLYVLLQNTKSYAQSTVNMALKGILSKGKLEELVYIVPPLSLQTQFAAFVQQIDKSKFAVQKSLEKAETLYKSLMQEYFA